MATGSPLADLDAVGYSNAVVIIHRLTEAYADVEFLPLPAQRLWDRAMPLYDQLADRLSDVN